MGPRVMRHLPKYVHGFIDRHGRPRVYFRCAGFKHVPLPGLPWSPEFMAAYEGALNAQPSPIGAKRTGPGSVNEALALYLQSNAFTEGLAPATQVLRRQLLERFRNAHGE